MEINCDIYKEILNRDDGVEALIHEYSKTDFDAEIYNRNPYIVWGYNLRANAEVFGCQFIVHLMDNSDNYEKYFDLISEVMAEKTVLYSALEDNEAKLYMSFSRDEEQYRDTMLSYESNVDLEGILGEDGFTATGSAYARSIEKETIYFTPGIYHKYGVDSSCLQWYSGDYSTEKKQSLNNSIAYNWYRLSSASPAYNCHSYAWLYASAANVYWLDTPETYMSSSVVSYIGSAVTLQSNDIIVMYNESGELVHSAVVCATPSGESGVYTISKLGGRGLYKAPLSELSTYYSCKSYRVYRIR